MPHHNLTFNPSTAPASDNHPARTNGGSKRSRKEHQRSIKNLQQKIKLLERLVRRGGATLVMDPVTGTQITVFFNTKPIVY